MPFEVMDQSGGTTSHFFEDAYFAAERHFGFRKPHTISDHIDGTSSIVGGKLASSPLKKLPPNGALSVHCAEMSQSIIARDQKAKLPVSEGSAKISSTSWNVMDYHPKSWSSLSTQPPPYSLNRSSGCGTQWESSLFSSSLSEIFGKKLQFLGNDIQSNQAARNVAYCHAEEEPFGSLEEIEAQTIGNLLPTEDDLFSGITNELEHNNAHGNSADDSEEFDLFSSGGGMELEGDALLVMGKANSDFFRGGCDSQGSSNSLVNEHPYDENPSRTLFVRNIDSNVEDSELKAFFGQYGNIRTLYTASKPRGFVMVSYYDIRAAQNAIKTIQNLPLWHKKLDIHYSTLKASEKDINQGTLAIFNLDPSVTVAELHQIFGVYGEIKDIFETMQKSDHKFIEYYDIRAAEAALAALNRSEVAGRQVKLEPSCSGTSLTQRPEQDLEEPNLCQSPLDDLSSGRVAAFCPGMTVSSNMDNVSTLISHSAAYSPVGAFIEPRQSSSFPSSLPSPVMMASIGKKIGLNESNRTMSESNHCLPSFHPHSLPEYHDSLADGIPYNSDTMGSMASANGFNMTDATNSRHIGGVRSNGHPLELNGGVFGSSGNGTCNLPGHHYIWNNSRHQHHSDRMIWQNSQPFVNGVHVHPMSHLPGFPRVAPVMLTTARSHFHVGSAPAINPSIWERQHAFSAEFPEASSFHLGSVGGMGFPGNSRPHPMKVASCNLLSHVGGSFMGVRSPQQMCHIFPGRNLMISMPSSFDSPNERVRNISHHRIESNANHSDKKQYELDIEHILLGEDSRTTLMIKNIPNKYNAKILLAAIDEHCRGTYDFIYLPIDFKNKCNVGYAFINMIDPQQIIPFHKAFSGKKWEKFNSEKVASLAYARIQGKAALIAHFQNSSLMNEDKRCRPIIFHTNGPNAGDPEPFPMGTNLKSRLGKPRTCGNKENHQNGNSSIFASGEDLSYGTDFSPGSD